MKHKVFLMFFYFFLIVISLITVPTLILNKEYIKLLIFAFIFLFLLILSIVLCRYITKHDL